MGGGLEWGSALGVEYGWDCPLCLGHVWWSRMAQYASAKTYEEMQDAVVNCSWDEDDEVAWSSGQDIGGGEGWGTV